MPRGIVEIGQRAFQKCANLKCVVFQEDSKLECIGRQCFCRSGLEEIIMPKSLRMIDNGAF